MSMKDKLRELAERWQEHEAEYAIVSDQGDVTWHTCADELLAILDTEGDGGAVGEKVCIDAVGRVERDMTGDLGINWVLEGGIHALEEGTWILCADREVTDDEGYGELYTHPARSGVVSDEDVRDAERWRYLRREVISASWLINGGSLVKALEDSCDPSAFDRAIDAAIQGERHER